MKAIVLIFMIAVLLLHINRTVQTPVVLNTFHNIPVDGCADYFFLSKLDENKRKYICVHDFAQIAYIKLNGKFEKLTYKQGKTTSDAIFTNKDYMLNIKVISKRATGPESYHLKAIMTIYKNMKVIITKNIIGDGGC